MDAIIKIGEVALFVIAIIFLGFFKWHQQKEKNRRSNLNGALGDGEIQTLLNSPNRKD